MKIKNNRNLKDNSGILNPDFLSRTVGFGHSKNNNSCGSVNHAFSILKHVHMLIPGICKYVTLHGKRDFATVGKLKILRRSYDPALPRWAQDSHQDPYQGEAKGSKFEGKSRDDGIGSERTREMEIDR